MYSASDIAKLIINWCNHYKIPITNLKIQKLLYFLQGEFSRKQHSKLIADDFYAWQLGPVVPSVYSEYAIYSSAQIPSVPNLSIELSQDDSIVIDMILKKYANMSTWDLVDKSHAQDPWKYNYQIFGDKSIIPYTDIEKYFREDRKA